MKSLGTLLFVVALAFYVAWPVYSGYEIKASLDAKDPARLAAKIDFPSVRASLRPAVVKKVESTVTDMLKKAGPGAVPMTDELRAKLMPGIIDAVLTALVTPEMLIRIHSDGRSLKEIIDGIVAEKAMMSAGLGDLIAVPPNSEGGGGGFGNLKQIAEKLGIDPGKALGGLTGTAAEPAAPEPVLQETAAIGARDKALGYGLDNIKRMGLSGPLSVEVAVSKDPKARDADLTAEMSFVNNDWVLTALVPKL